MRRIVASLTAALALGVGTFASAQEDLPPFEPALQEAAASTPEQPAADTEPSLPVQAEESLFGQSEPRFEQEPAPAADEPDFSTPEFASPQAAAKPAETSADNAAPEVTEDDLPQFDMPESAAASEASVFDPPHRNVPAVGFRRTRTEPATAEVPRQTEPVDDPSFLPLAPSVPVVTPASASTAPESSRQPVPTADPFSLPQRRTTSTGELFPVSPEVRYESRVRGGQPRSRQLIFERASSRARQRAARMESRKWHGISPARPDIVHGSHSESLNRYLWAPTAGWYSNPAWLKSIR